MRFKLFGQTGMRVSELALGTGTFGTAWGWGADRDESRRVFDRYVAAGGNFLDCADIYQFGEAERMVGEFIQGRRDHFVLSTKYSCGAARTAGVATTGNGRKAMIRSLEDSLRRLGTDHVDVFWVHLADGMTPVEEIVRGFDDLVRAGKMLYAGFSDFPAWRIARAATIAELRGWAPVAGIQAEYSLFERTAERELLPLAEGLGLAVMLWSPLGGGTLTGKYRRRDADGRLTRGGGPVRALGEREERIVDAVHAVAEELEATTPQVAIAWVRSKAAGAGTSHIPILGARTAAQLDDNLGALRLTLTADQLARLNAASAVPAGFPHELIGSAQMRARVSGGKWDEIDGASRVAA